MFYDVTIQTPVPYGGQTRKIADIKALREATRVPMAFGMSGNCMGLTDAKAAIEYGYANGSFVLRLTPEQYAAFNFNFSYGDLGERGDWYVDTVKTVFPEPESKFFTV